MLKLLNGGSIRLLPLSASSTASGSASISFTSGSGFPPQSILNLVTRGSSKMFLTIWGPAISWRKSLVTDALERHANKYLVVLRYQRRIVLHLGISVVVVDKVADTDKFLLSVGAGEEDSRHSDGVSDRNLFGSRMVSLKDELNGRPKQSSWLSENNAINQWRKGKKKHLVLPHWNRTDYDCI